MQKIIWICWLQGIENAPDLVKRCITSWKQNNPGWNIRVLDASSVGLYLDFSDYVDLAEKTITAASLSDIVRILLLHEYGGVWVDATLFCNRPLDSWLPEACATGFFAFSAPAPDRLLSSWFLACHPRNRLIAKWASKVISYWRERIRSDDYFWFHHLFGELCAEDSEANAAWQSVPKISADGPHSLQASGLMYKSTPSVVDRIDWTIPLFKLTHRIDLHLYQPGCLLDSLLQRVGRLEAVETFPATERLPPIQFAGLKVSTENLGDHIQIIAANKLLKRIGVTPSFCLDRDHELSSSPVLDGLKEPAGILLNGWFKMNPQEWPPHANLSPLYLGFHIRPFQAPSLLSKEAIEHYRRHGPIGCRDAFTLALLAARGVDAFHSNCLSLLLPKRFEQPDQQTELFVVSRDERILDYLPKSLGSYCFINHYSGSFDFTVNVRRASELLHMYRSRAKLIITTMLHCALPAIAMGIPVVVFYPFNEAQQHESDRERFSSLERMIRVFYLSEVAEVDWRGYVVDVSYLKIALLDAFLKMSNRWRMPKRPALGPVAPAECLPVP